MCLLQFQYMLQRAQKLLAYNLVYGDICLGFTRPTKPINHMCFVLCFDQYTHKPLVSHISRRELYTPYSTCMSLENTHKFMVIQMV